MADQTTAQRTLSDAKTLLLSIEQDWAELAKRPMSDLERKGVHHHMVWAISELAGLFAQLEKETTGAK